MILGLFAQSQRSSILPQSGLFATTTRENEQTRRQQRRLQLVKERLASLPKKQFDAQVEEVYRRFWEADPHSKLLNYQTMDTALERAAKSAVKERWVKQGIWKKAWGIWEVDGVWKHEEPLDLESEWETDTEAVTPPHDIFGTATQPKQRKSKSYDEKKRIAELRAIREREREASRPYYQFAYQISKQRERIQKESADGEGADNADINTRAYENVKNTWTKQGIWNGRWGILPGMLWKHELPFDEGAVHDPTTCSENAPVNSIFDAGGAPTRHVLGSSFPVVLNDGQSSRIMSTPWQGLSTDVDSARLENNNTTRVVPYTRFAQPSNELPVLDEAAARAASGQFGGLFDGVQKSGNMFGNSDGQQKPSDFHVLAGGHAAVKSSQKWVENRIANQALQNTCIFPESSSSYPPLLAGPDIAEPLSHFTSISPRRSKEAEAPEPSTAKGQTGVPSPDSPKVIARPRPKRDGAGNPKSTSSARRQGIFKRPHSTRTRQKARRNRD